MLCDYGHYKYINTFSVIIIHFEEGIVAYPGLVKSGAREPGATWLARGGYRFSYSRSPAGYRHILVPTIV